MIDKFDKAKEFLDNLGVDSFIAVIAIGNDHALIGKGLDFESHMLARKLINKEFDSRCTKMNAIFEKIRDRYKGPDEDEVDEKGELAAAMKKFFDLLDKKGKG